MLLKRLCLFLLFLQAGCRCPSSCAVPDVPCSPCSYELTVAENVPPNLAELLAEAGEDLCPLPTPEETYQLLDAAVCQCNAATNSTTANLVELERHWAKTIIECDSKNVRKNYCLDRDLLALHASNLRNKSAGSALIVFYQLAGLEAQRHFLRQGIDETRRSLKRLDNLRKEGLPLPQQTNRSQVTAKLHQLEDQQLQLQFTRLQLNGQLQTRLGCPLDERKFFWPQVDWAPDLSPLDVEDELAQGLATRSDVRGIRLVLCQMEKTTLPVARGILQLADGTVGSVEPTDGWIHRARCFRCNSHEVEVRCQQLAIFYADTEQNATAEIKNAAYGVALAQQRVVLARQTVDERRQHVHDLTSNRDVKNIDIFTVSLARGELFEAESKLLEHAVRLKVAEVSLKQAKGMLASECGFEPVLCLEGCCDGVCVGCKDQCSCERSSDCKTKCDTESLGETQTNMRSG